MNISEHVRTLNFYIFPVPFLKAAYKHISPDKSLHYRNNVNPHRCARDVRYQPGRKDTHKPKRYSIYNKSPSGITCTTQTARQDKSYSQRHLRDTHNTQIHRRTLHNGLIISEYRRHRTCKSYHQHPYKPHNHSRRYHSSHCILLCLFRLPAPSPCPTRAIPASVNPIPGIKASPSSLSPT